MFISLTLMALGKLTNLPQAFRNENFWLDLNKSSVVWRHFWMTLSFSGEKQRTATYSSNQSRSDVKRSTEVVTRNGRNRTGRQQTFRISSSTVRVERKYCRRKVPNVGQKWDRQIKSVDNDDNVEISHADKIGWPQSWAQGWGRGNEASW